jgi:hypothetical protein
MSTTKEDIRLLGVVIWWVAIAGGCTQPLQYSSGEMIHYDRDTEYHIDESDNRFVVTVNYSRYQFIPESDAVAMACKSTLINIAHDQAEKKGREIEPIDEQRIRISMGRNGLTGITSCSATVSVKWKGPSDPDQQPNRRNPKPNESNQKPDKAIPNPKISRPGDRAAAQSIPLNARI